MEAFLIGLLAIIVGLLLTFAGYQFFRFLIQIWGFFIGFTWGAQGVAVGLGGGFLATGMGWFVGLVVGLVIAALAYTFYELAVGLLAASVGYWLTMSLLTPAGVQQASFLAMFLALAVGIVLGVAVLYLRAPKGILVALSAFGGATAVIGGLLVMFGGVPVALLGSGIVNAIIGESALWFIVWIALAVVGLFAQLSLSGAATLDVSDYPASSTVAFAGSKGGAARDRDMTDKTIDKIEKEEKKEDFPDTDKHN